MRRLISAAVFFTISIVLVFTSGCSKSVSTDDITAFADYTLTPMEGTDVLKATKNVAAGEISEQGYILNGKKTGMWVTYFPNGRIESVRNYLDGKLYGVNMFLDQRGQVTEEKNYTADELDGMYTTYRFGRAQEEIPYTMGVVNGKVMRYHSNGKINESIEYKDGKQDGYYRHYNEEGVMDMEYKYANGEKVSGGIVETPANE